MSARNDGGPAFPRTFTDEDQYGVMRTASTGGMTLREWFAGQALSNPAICTGKASEYDLDRWFPRATSVDPFQIAAAQATAHADAMIAERDRDGDA